MNNIYPFMYKEGKPPNRKKIYIFMIYYYIISIFTNFYIRYLIFVVINYYIIFIFIDRKMYSYVIVVVLLEIELEN